MLASNSRSALLLLLSSSSLTSAQQQKPLLDQARSLAASGASRFNIPLPSAFAPPPPSYGERAQDAANAAKGAADSARNAADNAGKGAADSVKGAADAAQSVTEDVAAAAAAAAAGATDLGGAESLTWWGWRDVVRHSGEQGSKKKEDEIWMVYVTGNKTCKGHCTGLDKAWTEATVLFKTAPTSPSLATLNCDAEELLCGSWGAATGSIWTFQLPAPNPSAASQQTPIVIHNLNFTAATNADITRIHTRELWKYPERSAELSTSSSDSESEGAKAKPRVKSYRYEGMLHPFDGLIAKNGLVTPFAYAVWGLSKVPSWAVMVVISLGSRFFMSRQTNRTQNQPQQQPGQGNAAPQGAVPAGKQ
ncbi:MAG: hypothetical protein M1831_001444 [Alyxoria varia]|nr:MAG: hypothetical protein M1831_001444 [Alyxoria varia]